MFMDMVSTCMLLVHQSWIRTVKCFAILWALLWQLEVSKSLFTLSCISLILSRSACFAATQAPIQLSFLRKAHGVHAQSLPVFGGVPPPPSFE